MIIGKILYSAFALVLAIPFSRLIFGGSWLWYIGMDTTLFLIYIIGFFMIYNHIFTSLNNDKMATATSNPQKEVGLNYRDIELTTPTGHPIKGWYIPSTQASVGNPVLIYSHGFGLSREQLGESSYEQFKYFAARGYSVITFEYPIGEREGAHKVTGGALESEDLATVVDYAKEMGHEFVGLIGYSYGGNTSLYYAVNKVTPLVDAIILDSSIVVTPSILARQLHVWSGLPVYISRPFLYLLWKRKMGFRKDDHPIQNVFKTSSDIPILFWHGTSDRDAFYEVIESVYSKQSHPLTQLRTVQDGEHVELHTKVGESVYNEQTLDWLTQLNTEKLKA